MDLVLIPICHPAQVVLERLVWPISEDEIKKSLTEMPEGFSDFRCSRRFGGRNSSTSMRLPATSLLDQGQVKGDLSPSVQDRQARLEQDMQASDHKLFWCLVLLKVGLLIFDWMLFYLMISVHILVSVCISCIFITFPIQIFLWAHVPSDFYLVSPHPKCDSNFRSL